MLDDFCSPIVAKNCNVTFIEPKGIQRSLNRLIAEKFVVPLEIPFERFLLASDLLWSWTDVFLLGRKDLSDHRQFISIQPRVARRF